MAQPLSSNPDLIPIDPDPEDNDTFECLAKVKVGSFTATPTTVPPFGGPATLRWGVTVPSGCAVGLRLNGTPVARSGSKEVQPATTTSYSLAAVVNGLTKVLKSVTVRVDTSACVTRPVPESLIRSQVRSAVAKLDAAEPKLSQRSDPRVEIDANGIHVALRFKLAIDNFADPNIDVDFTIGLRVRNGSVEPFYKSFAVDVDWPWWVTVITAGVSKICRGVHRRQDRGQAEAGHSRRREGSDRRPRRPDPRQPAPALAEPRRERDPRDRVPGRPPHGVPGARHVRPGGQRRARLNRLGRRSLPPAAARPAWSFALRRPSLRWPRQHGGQRRTAHRQPSRPGTRTCCSCGSGRLRRGSIWGSADSAEPPTPELTTPSAINRPDDTTGVQPTASSLGVPGHSLGRGT